MKLSNPGVLPLLYKFAQAHVSRGIRPLALLEKHRYFNFDGKHFIEIKSVNEIKYRYLIVQRQVGNQLGHEGDVEMLLVYSTEQNALQVYPNPSREDMLKWLSRQEQGYIACHVFTQIVLLQNNTGTTACHPSSALS